ncbi:MAG: hypothetical protein JWP02_671 [Acidimicrobiales bacterium]|nr:hypothetical protein [Acidimicrobiales bacterium]
MGVRIVNRARRDDRGAFLIIWALLLVALLTMAAIVIDLSAVRTDRRGDRLSADSAVSAGAFVITDKAGGRYAACQAAWTYAAKNLSDGSVPADPCGPFQTGTDCTNSGTSPSQVGTATPSSASGSVGAFTVTITTPVSDSDPLLRADIIGGGASQPPVTSSSGVQSDGKPCERVAVTIAFTRNSFFGGIVGSGSHTTNVHSVARRVQGVKKVPASLVMLAPRECDLPLTATGSGNISIGDPSGNLEGGSVIVSLANDTSGGGATCKTQGTQHDYSVEGYHPNSIVVINGNLYLGAQGWNPPCSGYACNEDQITGGDINISDMGQSNIEPLTMPAGAGIDRTLVDYLFNCGNYTGANRYNQGGGSASAYQPLNPPRDSGSNLANCSGTTGNYVSAYVKAVQGGALNPSGTTVGANPASACPAIAAVISGDVVFNCDVGAVSVTVHGSARFLQTHDLTPSALVIDNNAVVENNVKLTGSNSMAVGGNSRFGGTVTLTGGTLTLGGVAGSTYPTACYASTNPGFTAPGFLADTNNCVRQFGTDFHTAYFDSSVTQSGGQLVGNHTFAYGSSTAALKIGGGGGLDWHAPTAGPMTQPVPDSPGSIAALGLWSDYNGEHGLDGSGTLSLGGVFFAPAACWKLTGTFPVTSEPAQFIAYCMNQTGGGTFNLLPSLNFVGVPISGGPLLIR